MPEPRRARRSRRTTRASIKAIEKAIQQSDLGINPSNDGQIIRLMFPELTEERRKELVKVVKHQAEEGRVAVRNVRRQARHELEALEKDGDLAKDDLDRAEKELEKRTHEVVAEIDELLKHKEHGAARGLDGQAAPRRGSGASRDSSADGGPHRSTSGDGLPEPTAKESRVRCRDRRARGVSAILGADEAAGRRSRRSSRPWTQRGARAPAAAR